MRLWIYITDYIGYIYDIKVCDQYFRRAFHEVGQFQCLLAAKQRRLVVSASDIQPREAVQQVGQSLLGIRLPQRPAEEQFVASSIQFNLPGFSTDQIKAFLAVALERGVELKWFGADEPVGFTSRHDSWSYVEHQQLPQTDRVLSTLIDMRLPLTFCVDDCKMIGRIIRECAMALNAEAAE